MMRSQGLIDACWPCANDWPAGTSAPAAQEAAIRTLGMNVEVLPTVMRTRSDKRKLAPAPLAL